ncbi:MAG: retropepsin-like domain-containing protein [Alphaproteobacteria bacterium]|nr:retropepsin-like domain-containing protein [Alphaproteobacteria bacterium]
MVTPIGAGVEEATLRALPLTLALSACAHLGPFPTPDVEYGAVAELPLVQVAEDTRRLYVLVDTGAMGEQLWFLDTGYSHTTCDAQVMAQVGLETRPTLARTRGELGTVRLRKARLPDFRLGEHEVQGLRCAVRDLPATSSIPEVAGYRVAGVIGSNLLRPFVLEVDPAAGVMRLYPSGSVEIEPGFEARREHLVGQRLRVPLVLDGEEHWPILDYGATGTYLDAGRAGLPLVQEREGTWKGTGGESVRTIRYHRAEQVAFGGVDGPGIYVVDRPGRRAGLVGMNVLGGYRLILDYDSGLGRVEPVERGTLPVVGGGEAVGE